MTIEEIPSDELTEMTAAWHKAFNVFGCNPMCHCCYKFIIPGKKFKLSTVFEAPKGDACLHWYKDLNELQIKALKGEAIEMADLKKLKEDFFFDSHFEKKGGLSGITELVQPSLRDVMLCETCNPKTYIEKEIKILNKEIVERDDARRRRNSGGCFRINGKIVH